MRRAGEGRQAWKEPLVARGGASRGDTERFNPTTYCVYPTGTAGVEPAAFWSATRSPAGVRRGPPAIKLDRYERPSDKEATL